MTRDEITNIYGFNYLLLNSVDIKKLNEVGNNMGWPEISEVLIKYPDLTPNQKDYYNFARADLLIGDTVDFSENRPCKYIMEIEAIAGIQRKQGDYIDYSGYIASQYYGLELKKSFDEQVNDASQAFLDYLLNNKGE